MEKNISEQALKEAIEQLLNQGDSSLAGAAQHFDISTRTLQRRLTESGLTYSQLVDDVRFDMARRMLMSNNVRLRDIAAALGYADASSFTRAFERWAGVCPREFRYTMHNVN